MASLMFLFIEIATVDATENKLESRKIMQKKKRRATWIFGNTRGRGTEESISPSIQVFLFI
jgi:hypothetical protein